MWRMGVQENLVKLLIAEGVLYTPTIIKAFQTINRRDFVLEGMQEQAYLNIPLPIGEGQTISQPYTVAFMLELLQPQVGQNILDIGSGSGWLTALLAHIVGSDGHVTAIEIISSLCEMGKKNVGKYSYIDKGVVEMHCMSGLAGYAPRAPYDGIIASAAGGDVPAVWLEQTKVGGRIVMPIGSSVLQLLRVTETDWQRTEYPGFAFVPLVGG